MKRAGEYFETRFSPLAHAIYAKRRMISVALIVIGAALGPLFPALSLYIIVSVLAFWSSSQLLPRNRMALLVSAWVYIYNFRNTELTERNLDVLSHLEYISYLCTNHELPPGSHCLVCHHPPLYHLISAIPFKLADGIAWLSPETSVQCLALAFGIAFAVAGARIFEFVFKGSWFSTLGTVLAALWPYSILLSARLHNDVAANAWMAWSLHGCFRYYNQPNKTWLWWALGFAIASVLTKMSGLVAIAIVVATVLGRALFKTPSESKDDCQLSNAPFNSWTNIANQLRPTLLPLLATATFLAGFMVLRDHSTYDPNSIARFAQGPQDTDTKGQGQSNAGAGVFGSAFNAASNQRLDSPASDYLYVDISDLLREPYAIAQASGTGKTLFWNHFLKSSLFSTHNGFADGETSYRLNRNIASIMLLIELILLGQMLVFVATSKPRLWMQHWTALVSVTAMIGGALAFRIIEPTSHHSDFRHVYPILLPSLVIFLIFVQHNLKRNTLLSSINIILPCLFCALSVFYFVPKYTWFQPTLKTEDVTHPFAYMACRSGEEAAEHLNLRARLDWTQKLVVHLSAPQRFSELTMYVEPYDGYELRLSGTKKEVTQRLAAIKDEDGGVARHIVSIPAELGALQAIELRPTLGRDGFGVGCAKLE